MRTISACALVLSFVSAEAKPISLADYPLRVQVYHRTVRRHSMRRFLMSVTGSGRANVFENHEAHGIDFTYDCSGGFMQSSGPETYPARWIEPGLKVQIVIGEIRHPDKVWTCDLDVQEKNFAYKKRSNNTLASVPVEEYKRWMQDHGYDPETGKDIPMDAPVGARRSPR